jgi:predicted anti-sigma-YlaC factor YlaD
VTCREFIDFLSAYLDRELSTEEMDRFDGHLSVCPACVDYMKTYEHTIRLTRYLGSEPDSGLPDDVPEDLVKAILASRKKV